MSNEMPPTTAGSGRSLALVVGVVLVLAVAVAAIVTSLRPSPQLDPATPEGTVQAFFQAVEADDWNGVLSLLSSQLREDCEASELAQFRDDVDRAVISDVDAAGSETIVEVRVTRVVIDDPLNPYSYDDTFHFVLAQEDGRPVVVELPWQFYCEGVR
ncbi:MAG TPA: hypothetical protein VJQ79_02130 [Acidimicrobiia bacterium]|nr:hypothetical protein [Acidimicrobiia bacterium]